MVNGNGGIKISSGWLTVIGIASVLLLEVWDARQTAEIVKEQAVMAERLDNFSKVTDKRITALEDKI